jgi:hypothetical protein
MKFKKIVGFGDSWMYGDELLDPVLAASDPEAHCCWVQNTEYREQQCFLGQLGQHYGVPTENFGIPGGSLRSSIWTYLWWLEHEPSPSDCLVLVALTEADRETFYNPTHVHYSNDPPWNKFVHSTWVEYGSSVIDQDWRTMVKQHMVLSASSGLRRLNYLETVHFFNGQAAAGVNLLQFHTMPPPVQTPVDSMIMPDHYWTIYFRDHPGNQNRELIKSGGHPNEKGHEIIRDRLITEIDRAILAQ